MRYPLFFTLYFLLSSVSVWSQHPLVGTWELITTKGISVDGDPFMLDTTSVREIKIITPTHYILIAHDVDGDSLVFNRSYAGRVAVQGNRYTEVPLMSSLQIVPDLKTDFRWDLKGNLFIQSGTVTRPDGKQVQIELTFRKVATRNEYPDNPALGTWQILSSTTNLPDGKTLVEKAPEVQVIEIITPSHWMGISTHNGTFENAMGGTYTLKDGKFYPERLYSALPMDDRGQVVLETQRDGDQLVVTGILTTPDGKTYTWKDVAEPMK
jgi:hypothetical protein